MKKYWLAAIGLVLVLAAVTGCATMGTTYSNSQQQGIWVSGEGKVTITPDIAILSLGIEAQAVTVAEAQSQAAEAMDRVINALTDNGVAEKDIQTQYFSISQVTSWDKDTGEEIVTGYRVTNMATVKVREIDETGAIIDAVAAAGGDLTRINSIDFSVDDPSPYYDEAREAAVADARAKAEQLAELANVKLGEPTYISEWASSPISSREIYYGGAAPAPTPISPGELELTLSVQVAYAID